MDVVEKMSISHFIWYLLPGLAFLLLVFFPILVLNIDAAGILYSKVGSWGALILAVVLGFLIEGLRLYRFRFGYQATRKYFYPALKSLLNEESDPYFLIDRTKDFARSKGMISFELKHSIWIMLGQITILFLIECIFWIVYFVYVWTWNISSTYSFFTIEISRSLFMTSIFGLIILFALITSRFHYVSIKEQVKFNEMILSFARINAQKIKETL